MRGLLDAWEWRPPRQVGLLGAYTPRRPAHRRRRRRHDCPQESPLVIKGTPVRGGIYDVDTGAIRWLD